MGIKVIIFDVDGVLVTVPHYFTQELQNSGYNNANEILNEYYMNENTLCAEGKGNAKELISPYLEKIGWDGGSEEYFREQFAFEEEYIQRDLVELISVLQNNKIKCYLGTDQEENRAQFLLEGLGLGYMLDGNFISCRVGHRKNSQKFWEYVKQTLGKQGVSSQEIVFFDDMQSNIDVALGEGIHAFLYTDLQQCKRDLKEVNINYE